MDNVKPAPGVMESVRAFFIKYVDFHSRSRRAEYWKVVLFNILVYIPLGIILGGSMTEVLPYVGTELDTTTFVSRLDGTAKTVLALYSLYYFICLIPSWALMVRRLHDIGLSGWFLLLFVVLGFVPYLNILSGIVLLALMCIDSKRTPNRWGESPKYIL